MVKITKIDLNVPIKNLEGESGTVSLGKQISVFLVGPLPGFEQHSIKIYQWALKLHEDESIDLDHEDLNLFKKVIDSLNNLTIIGRAQLLLRIQECEDHG